MTHSPIENPFFLTMDYQATMGTKAFKESIAQASFAVNLQSPKNPLRSTA